MVDEVGVQVRPRDAGAYERDFRKAGLPLFIEDYSAAHDIFNRATPLLALVFIVEVFGAVNLNWPWYVNVAAVLAGLAIVLGAIGALNRSRGHRVSALPPRLGVPELTCFVVIPALLPLIFGGQWRSALSTAAGNLVLLGLIYAVVGYGLIAIVGWALRRVAGQLTASLSLLTKALPLLLLFALVLFVNTEMWTVTATMPRPFLIICGVLFVALGTLFLAARLPREVRALERDAGGSGPPLRRRQRLNVGLVLLVSQGLQVIIVSAAMFAFLVVFGALAINTGVQAEWGVPGEEQSALLPVVTAFGGTLVVTEALVRVAAMVSAFSALYYTIAVLTDSTYREEFLDEVTDEMRGVFRARTEYLSVLDRA
ncbi:MAG: hypothetical protein GEV11_19560 [Streptosporangiales bacterium]|nr:hypothetical protein [Streptosporangiales bacterium]